MLALLLLLLLIHHSIPARMCISKSTIKYIMVHVLTLTKMAILLEVAVVRVSDRRCTSIMLAKMDLDSVGMGPWVYMYSSTRGNSIPSESHSVQSEYNPCSVVLRSFLTTSNILGMISAHFSLMLLMHSSSQIRSNSFNICEMQMMNFMYFFNCYIITSSDFLSGG